MKKILSLLVLLSCSLFAQNVNLNGLNNVYVNIQSFGVLSDKSEYALKTDIQLKLLSAGVKTNQDYLESTASLNFMVNYIKSAFAEDRILIILKLVEPVKVPRTKLNDLEAITYFDYQFFTAPNVQLSKIVYDNMLNDMFVSFINKYLTDNPK